MTAAHKLGIALAFALTMGFATVAVAPLVSATTLTMSACNTDLCANGVTGPFGTVTLTLVGSSINVSVNMNAGFGLFGNGGGGGAFGFNQVAPDTTLTITNLTTGFTADSSNTMDGFGMFDKIILGPPAGSPASSLAFTVDRVGGFTSVDQLIDGSVGGTGALFAAHVKVTAGVGQGQTGFAAVVPEPGTLALFGTGLVAAGWRRWRRRA